MASFRPRTSLFGGEGHGGEERATGQTGKGRGGRDLVRASFSKYVERIGREPAPMLEDYTALIRAGEVWVLAEGGEVLGVLVMRPAEDHLFVDNVAVAPRHQGKGLGRELVAFAEEKAAEHGLPEVRLYTNEKMHENLDLRQAGLRGDRQAPRRGLPARLHAQAASLMGQPATGPRGSEGVP